MTATNFVTCDVLDAHYETNPSVQVCAPYMDGKRFWNYGGVASFSGRIVTAKCFEDNSIVKTLLATDGTGKVLVVDGGASMRCALMGDLIAASAVDNNWQGVIIYGCVRDVDALAALPLGVQALASIPLKSTRKGLGEQGLTLHFGGMRVQDGHYVYADNNGIVLAETPLII